MLPHQGHAKGVVARQFHVGVLERERTVLEVDLVAEEVGAEYRDGIWRHRRFALQVGHTNGVLRKGCGREDRAQTHCLQGMPAGLYETEAHHIPLMLRLATLLTSKVNRSLLPPQLSGPTGEGMSAGACA